MNTITTKLLRTATIVAAIAASGAALAQTAPQSAATANNGTAATTASATKAATSGSAAQNAVAGSAAAASKAQPTGLTRAQVQAEFLEARKNGTLLQTEADFDVAQTRKHVAQ